MKLSKAQLEVLRKMEAGWSLKGNNWSCWLVKDLGTITVKWATRGALLRRGLVRMFSKNVYEYDNGYDTCELTPAGRAALHQEEPTDDFIEKYARETVVPPDWYAEGQEPPNAQ